MREEVEFRIEEEWAAKHLPDNLGVRLGDSVRKVTVNTEDPIYEKIGRLDKKFRAQDDYFFLGWFYQRRYTRSELNRAKLFYVWPHSFFQPVGEECGTIYDDSKACEECGGGAPQVTPLYLPERRLPRRADFAKTMAGEIVITSRVVDLFAEYELTGAEFAPLLLSDKGGEPSTTHHQLKIVGAPLELDASVRAGERPFDYDSYGRCSRGDTYGHALLSEVTVKRSNQPGNDIMETKQLIGGCRMGDFRPRPLLLMSPRAFHAIQDANLKNLAFEVAYYVDS